MEEIFDSDGLTVAWLHDGTVRDPDGFAVAFIRGTAVYDYDGVQIGFFGNGYFQDGDGNAIAFIRNAHGGPLPPVIQLSPMQPLPRTTPYPLIYIFKTLSLIK
jgi:hypothetical protein